MPMTETYLPFDDFLQLLRDEATSNQDQGYQFEKAMVALLPQHPTYGFDAAWLWRDWPQREAVTGLNAQDDGIDIVARKRDTGEFWAVQCKFYGSEKTIAKGHLDSFFSESGKKGFSGRLIITTTDNWTSTAENTLENQQITTHRLRLNDLRDLSINWNWVRPDKTHVAKDQIKKLYPHQEAALDAAKAHFATHDRGKLIMACGTGKTFTSLKIAEKLIPMNRYVLFVVPSLSLMRQTITEWAWERELDHRYLGICSDASVGRGGDEAATKIADLTVPVTTNPSEIASHLTASKNDEDAPLRMNVVFCTYQSLDRLSEAQQRGAPEFDLIICDEAHRTTGVDRENQGNDEKNSNFVKIHDQDFIKGRKRMYMTATPRIYEDTDRDKANEMNIGIYSMDDESQFGKQFYRLGFGEAVDEGLLSDYRVIVLNVAQEWVAQALSKLDQETLKNLDPATDDAAKIIGCYKALRDQGKEDEEGTEGGGIMLKRAVSFSSSIKNSKIVVEKFSAVVKALDEFENDGFTCQLDHVDGTQTSLDRSKKLDWLKEPAERTEDGEVCRILSNAKCLTEGVDVPSLDAILFMNPRKSQIDVVQAVGRVMRKAPGKQYGYVILPVVIPEGADIQKALDSNKAFDVVWEVLRGLRAHDGRLANYISQIELNKNKPPIIDVIGVGFGGDGDEDDRTSKITNAAIQLNLEFSEELAGLIYAKIVEKVGDRRYLEHWAKDTAELHDLLVERINGLRDNNAKVQEIYHDFLKSLQATIHDGLDENDASSMLAQQLITRPVFDALFEGYQFSRDNVISASLNTMLDKLSEYGLEAETEKLKGFYESVTDRVSGLDNDEARQKVITELYEKFFTTAFPKTSESLGIAYTPMELVDFTLKSADEVMRAEFGRGLTDEGVHVIDPFTGTGSFLVRLLNNPDLIRDADLHRKFNSELWANEILLLAYYIASVNIEMAFHQRGEGGYQSFPGISLTDTFEMFERDDKAVFSEMLEANNERITAQRKAPIRVVVGNPPWSAGQRSQNDNNANRAYPTLDESIGNSYVRKSIATNRNALYDSYIRAIRWASDRIGDKGVVAFVTNAGWLDAASADGMRLCLEEEFDAIYLFNLRGNARTSGEQRRKESGHVFGQSSRAPVVISLFVKNPANRRPKAEIKYHDIGDYLRREQKLEIIRNAGAISGLEWKTITPNPEGDWLNLRDPLFQTFMELGNDAVRRGNALNPETIFHSYSRGVETTRDAWAYNFSHDKVANNMQSMIVNYNRERAYLQDVKKAKPHTRPEEVLETDSTRISWSSSLISYAERNVEGKFDAKNIRLSLYRPFAREHLYLDPTFTHRTGKTFYYFPTSDAENHLICVTGKGAKSEFSCLMTNTMPCLGIVDATQTFPRWTYRQDEATGEMAREDNITDHALGRFQAAYKDGGIAKDDIFNYVYGILHAPDYRGRFATDLRLGLPRIPLADNFWAFAEAGARLADYHLNWPLDGTPEYSTDLGYVYNGKPNFSPDLIPDEAFVVKKLAWQGRPEGKFIKYSQHFSIGPIPEPALASLSEVVSPPLPEEWVEPLSESAPWAVSGAAPYTIGNRTPLQWIIDRYQVKKDKDSGITNDPNDWITEQGRPDALVELIKRVTYLSIKTAEIIATLPPAVKK